MPFTASHSALILPLLRRRQFSVTALIVGSIVPDFEFFMQMKEVENIGHYWYGILLFDLPMGLLLCYLFHTQLRNLLIANAPKSIQARVSTMSEFDWKKHFQNNPGKIILSLLTGIVSHLFLDAFTHYDGFFVTRFSYLSEYISGSKIQVPVYQLLQYLFSIIGLIAIGNSIYKIPENRNIITVTGSQFFWPAYIGLTFLIIVIRLTCWPAYNSFGGIAIAIMGSISYSSVAVSFFLNYSQSKKTTI